MLRATHLGVKKSELRGRGSVLLWRSCSQRGTADSRWWCFADLRRSEVRRQRESAVDLLGKPNHYSCAASSIDVFFRQPAPVL